MNRRRVNNFTYVSPCVKYMIFLLNFLFWVRKTQIFFNFVVLREPFVIVRIFFHSCLAVCWWLLEHSHFTKNGTPWALSN